MDIVRLLGTTSLEVQNEEKSKRDGWQELYLARIYKIKNIQNKKRRKKVNEMAGKNYGCIR